MEYTLEDAYETLKEDHAKRLKEIEHLMQTISNDKEPTLNRSSSLKDIDEKRRNLCQSLLHHIQQEEPKDYPVSSTSDLHIEVISELHNEVDNAQKLLDQLTIRLNDINDDIAYLEAKKSGLEKMKEACLNATETVADGTYALERSTAKRIFHNVKGDLKTVVNILFPEHQGVIELLAELSLAYFKGGDDKYIDIQPEDLKYINFLIEADIVKHHRNDKNKMRLLDML